MNRGQFRAWIAGLGCGGAMVAINLGNVGFALAVPIAAFMTWALLESIAYVARHLRVSWEREVRHAD